MNTRILFSACVASLLLFTPQAGAGAKSKAAQEAVEFAAKKLGWKIGQEGLETAVKKLETQAVKHGPDMIEAFRRVGAKSFSVAEKHGASGLKMVARHGDDALVHVLARPKALGLVAKLGDDAVEALVKHPGIAEGVLEKLGKPAAKALVGLGPRSGRRLVMMTDDLAKIGRTDEVLAVISKFGDKGMSFIWDNKMALTTATVLASFLADPALYIDAGVKLGSAAAEHVAAPVAEAAGEVVVAAGEAAVAEVAEAVGPSGNWFGVFLSAGAVVALLAFLWLMPYALCVWRGASLLIPRFVKRS